MTRRRRNRGRAAVIATVTAVAGCAAHPGGPAKPRPNIDAPAVDPVLAAIRRDALDQAHYARAVLYTWTTQDQITELRRSQRLLVRDESPTHGASYLDQVLYVLAQKGDPVAKLLYTTAFAKMRFAWHAPWATVAGWPNERYGDRLIRVTLAREAVIVAISAERGIVGAHDLLDRPVSLDQVRAHPERVGAIYFVSDKTVDPVPGVPAPTATFREFALCNESMIESWEVGTNRIAQELADAATLVDGLAKLADGSPVEVPGAWWHPLRDPKPALAYAAALAFTNPNYRFERTVLSAIAAQLRAVPRITELTAPFGPAPAFVPGVARKPPRIVRGSTETYVRWQPSPTAAKP